MADTPGQGRRAHRLLVDHLRALSRRSGSSGWRLIGLRPTVAPAAQRPSLDDWAAEQGLDGWSQRELLILYEEAFPVDRKALQAQRLLKRQLEELRRMQAAAAQRPQPTDLVPGWFDERLAERLVRSGRLTLADLQRDIARGGRWYRNVPGVGATKARRIAEHLRLLLGEDLGVELVPLFTEVARARAGAGSRAVDALSGPAAVPAVPAGRGNELDGSQGLNRATPLAAGTTARTDLEAIEAWLVAKAGRAGEPGFVAATARAYRTQAERLLLWCLREQRKPLSSMTVEDCEAYKAFLARVPEHWISRRHARRHGVGWTPFAGQLSLGSQQQAITIVRGLFEWLVASGYLLANPWTLLRTKLVADAEQAAQALDGIDPTTKALGKKAFEVVLGFVMASKPSPSRSRMRFLLEWGRGTGMRAAELLGCDVRALRWVETSEGSGWVLPVQGKGAKARSVAVPTSAMEALERYLAERGLGTVEQVLELQQPVPLLASTADPMAAPCYQALYDSTVRWMRKAAASPQAEAAGLTRRERDRIASSAIHTLRHTAFTRMGEAGVPVDVIMAQAGHASPATAAGYTRSALARQLIAVQGALG